MIMVVLNEVVKKDVVILINWKKSQLFLFLDFKTNLNEQTAECIFVFQIHQHSGHKQLVGSHACSYLGKNLKINFSISV